MGRMIAQLVCFSLLPEAAADAERTHLQDLFSFLRDNPDMVSQCNYLLSGSYIRFHQAIHYTFLMFIAMLWNPCTGENAKETAGEF